MKTLLENYDSESKKCFLSLQGTLGEGRFMEEIKEIEKHIENFDFDLAIPQLTRIASGLNISLKGSHHE